MGLRQSKEKRLYQQVFNGNIEAIKSLHNQGATLEWKNVKGKTPLILACMDSSRYNVAKTLIELGANVNAYRRGRNGGTPLHHAAGRGLEQMVKLLLSHGANALVLNDNCQTALDLARENGYSNVVRAIEKHICLFSGWLHQLYTPRLHHLCLFRRKVWVVVLPCVTRKPTNSFNLQLAIYSRLESAKPRLVTPLGNDNVDELNFNHHNPSVLISSFVGRNIKLAPDNDNENGKQQLQQFSNACKGIRQVTHHAKRTTTSSAPPSVPSEPPTTPPWAPSAPPISDMVDDGPVHYPPIDFTPIKKEKDGSEFSKCVVCLDAPIEGACIPCGDMVGCMSCLNEIKGNNWVCPVCCEKVYQVVQLCAL